MNIFLAKLIEPLIPLSRCPPITAGDHGPFRSAPDRANFPFRRALWHIPGARPERSPPATGGERPDSAGLGDRLAPRPAVRRPRGVPPPLPSADVSRRRRRLFPVAGVRSGGAPEHTGLESLITPLAEHNSHFHFISTQTTIDKNITISRYPSDPSSSMKNSRAETPFIDGSELDNQLSSVS